MMTAGRCGVSDPLSLPPPQRLTTKIELNITEHTELGDNSSIKQAAGSRPSGQK